MTTVRGTRTEPPVRNVDGYEIERRVARTLEGREAFTGFMGDGVIDTANVSEAAITAGSAGAVSGVVSLSGSAETQVAGLTITTTGGVLEVDANFHMTVWHPTAGNISVTIRMYRGATVVFSKTFPAINGDLLQGWQTPRVVEQPAAGTYEYRVTVQASVSNWETAEIDAANISIREFKR